MVNRTAVVRRVDGLTFLGRADTKHWVAMDGPESFGGSNAATRPKELVLLALGGCTGSDVAAILQKKRVPVQSLEIRLSAEEAEEHPQVFTSIHVEVVVTGDDIRAADVPTWRAPSSCPKRSTARLARCFAEP
jgi:putative redox protein